MMTYTNRERGLGLQGALLCAALLLASACEVEGSKDAFPSGAGNGGVREGFASGGGGGIAEGFKSGGSGGILEGYASGGSGSVQQGFPQQETGGGFGKAIGVLCATDGDCLSGLCTYAGDEPDEWSSKDIASARSKVFFVCTAPCGTGEDEEDKDGLSQGSCPTGTLCNVTGFCMPACSGDCHACAKINKNLTCDSDVCRCYSDVCIEGYGADELDDCGRGATSSAQGF